jgi:hypothetical protein
MTPEALRALADDPELVEELFHLYMTGLRGPTHLARGVMRRRTGEDLPAVPEGLVEVVAAALHPTEGKVMGLVVEAQCHPESYAKQRLQRRAVGKALDAMEYLCDRERNEDKRTLNSASQFVLGAGVGLTPTQKVEVSAAEEMLRLQQALFGKPAESPDAL